MKQLSYLYRIEAQLELSASEINTLRVLAIEHYDGKCQAAARQGGFLYGWWNTNGMGGMIYATADQADTVCKILELPNAPHILSLEFKQLLKNMTDEWKRLNVCE